MIIDLGSGPNPKMDANIRIDVNPWPEVTHVIDIKKPPFPFEDNIAEKIYFGDVIEHITIFEITPILNEIFRLLKPGGVVEVTTPDFEWICKRVANNDWKEQANVSWLNKHDDDFLNAMSYFFGGWVDSKEYAMPGMGHVFGYSEKFLKQVLEDHKFVDIERILDTRNPLPAANSIIKMLAYKPSTI